MVGKPLGKYKIVLVSVKGFVVVDVNGTNVYFNCDVSDKKIGDFISLPSQAVEKEPVVLVEEKTLSPEKEGVSYEKRNRKNS